MKYLKIVLLSLVLVGCDTLTGVSGVKTKTSNLPALNNQAKAAPVWSSHAGSGIGSNDVKLVIAIADNKIYTADNSGKVIATALRTGQVLWETSLKVPVISGPATGMGLVVVGTNNAEVVALNAKNGAILWKTPVSSQVLTSPKVYAATVLAKTIDGKLYSLNYQTGRINWVYDHGAPTMTLRGGGAPQVIGNIVIAGFADGKLAAFNRDQGKILWDRSMALPYGASDIERMVDVEADPIATDSYTYVATYHGNVASVATQTGQVQWQHDLSSNKGLDLDGNFLFVTDASDHVWAFYQKNGAVAWEQNLLAGRNLTAPTKVGKYIVVGDGKGYLHWLSREDGHLVSRVLVDKSGIVAPPVAVNNLVLATARNGLLAMYQLSL